MSRQFHGVTSLGLVGVAAVIAAITSFRTSWVLGVLYLVICVAAPMAILYTYCAKCACRAHCGHVFPGKVAGAFHRQPGPYTTTELAIMALGLLALLGLPQLWLWRHSGWFVAFWALNAVAVMQIRVVVCRSCENVYCPLRGQ